MTCVTAVPPPSPRQRRRVVVPCARRARRRRGQRRTFFPKFTSTTDHVSTRFLIYRTSTRTNSFASIPAETAVRGGCPARAKHSCPYPQKCPDKPTRYRVATRHRPQLLSYRRFRTVTPSARGARHHVPHCRIRSRLCAHTSVPWSAVSQSTRSSVGWFGASAKPASYGGHIVSRVSPGG